MTTLEILIAARDLIADPARWTQGAWARDKDGLPAPPTAGRACSWCTIGAVLRVVMQSPAASTALAVRLLNTHCKISPTYTNDHDGHAAVIALYDRCIEAERRVAG